VTIASVTGGFTGQSSTSGTSFTLTTSATINATGVLGGNRFALMTVATDNSSTVDGDNNEHTSVTGGAGTWSKLGEYTNSNGAAANGCTTSLWLFVPNGNNETSTTFTINLASAVVDKCASLWVFSKGEGANLRIDTATSVQTSQVDAANGFGSSSFSGLPTQSRLYFRALGKQANSATQITQSANFTPITAARSRNNTTSIMVRGEFRINTSTGETSNPTLAVSGDTAGLFVAIEEYYVAQGQTGSYTLTGGQMGSALTRRLAADGASYSLAGSDATLTYTPGPVALRGMEGAYSLAGGSAGATVSRVLQATGVIDCTWNPADKAAGITLSNGNLTATSTSGINQNVRSTASSPGKFVFSATKVAGSKTAIGVANAAKSLTEGAWATTNSVGYYSDGGVGYGNGSPATYAPYSNGDVIMVAGDAVAGKVWFYKNGVCQGGDPVAGTGGISIASGSPLYALFNAEPAGASMTANFGATPFSSAVPAGFSALGSFDAADVGYVLTGGALGSVLTRSLAGLGAIYALTGGALSARVGRVLAVTGAAYVLTGGAAVLTYEPASTGSTLTAETGVYTLTGGSASLALARVFVAAGAAYTMAGGTLTATVSRVLSVTGASYNLAGGSLAATVAMVIAATGASYALAGGALSARVGRVLAVTGAAYVLIGGSATLGFLRTMETLGGNYALAGGALGTSLTRRFAAEGASYTLAFGAASFRLRRPVPTVRRTSASGSSRRPLQHVSRRPLAVSNGRRR